MQIVWGFLIVLTFLNAMTVFTVIPQVRTNVLVFWGFPLVVACLNLLDLDSALDRRVLPVRGRPVIPSSRWRAARHAVAQAWLAPDDTPFISVPSEPCARSDRSRYRGKRAV